MPLFIVAGDDYDYYPAGNGTSDDFNGPACPPEYIDPFYDPDADPNPDYGNSDPFDDTDYDVSDPYDIEYDVP